MNARACSVRAMTLPKSISCVERTSSPVPTRIPESTPFRLSKSLLEHAVQKTRERTPRAACFIARQVSRDFSMEAILGRQNEPGLFGEYRDPWAAEQEIFAHR